MQALTFDGIRRVGRSGSRDPLAAIGCVIGIPETSKTFARAFDT
jgi:hypothetical protein